METTIFDAPLDASRWAGMRRHARLWRGFLSLALVREAQFRAHLLATVSVGLIQIAIALIPILLLFGFTESVRGWTRADVIVLVGMHQLVSAMLAMFIAPNMTRMTEYITHGDLDLMLVRPVNTQFYVTTRWMQPAELFNILTGLALIAFGLVHTGSAPGALDAGKSILLLVMGFVLLTCAWSALSFCAFWMSSVTSITFFFYDTLEAGRYPVIFFPTVIRMVLTFVVPLAFATTFPAQSLTGGITGWVVLGGIAFSALALGLVRAFWLRAVRLYASASS
ncbi:MAG TPA: ABC-2 family transporter protein [Thermomicrobiales bacterium]|nr:ABC-2 family transporter protein [Thermomicrobiales bacterium]